MSLKEAQKLFPQHTYSVHKRNVFWSVLSIVLEKFPRNKLL